MEVIFDDDNPLYTFTICTRARESDSESFDRLIVAILPQFGHRE
jgi:hypothetical protein